MSCADCERATECHKETNYLLERINDAIKDVSNGRIMMALEGLESLETHIIKNHNVKMGRS